MSNKQNKQNKQQVEPELIDLRFEEGSQSWQNLLAIAGSLKTVYPNHRFEVEDIYADADETTVWTNIVCYYDGIDDDIHSWQMLYKEDIEVMRDATDDEQLKEMVATILTEQAHLLKPYAYA